jgi:hypothetical protein
MNSLSPKNYLFLLPEMITLEEQNEVARAAKALLAEGYVYFFSAHEKTTVDREEIRFLPLHGDRLPYFGDVSGVLVARDQQLARQARQVYQGAPVMIFEPGGPLDVASHCEEERPAIKSTRWPKMEIDAGPLRYAA